MHEVALAQGIVDIVREQATRAACRVVKVVHLRVGALSSVEPEALLFGFESAARGTVVEGATLAIERTLGKARCMGCERDAQVESRLALCPHCGSGQLLITGGDELRITELEVL